MLCFYHLDRAISGGKRKSQHLKKLQSWKKCSVFVWECPKCAIWLNAFFWRSISQKVSQQNCWSPVSVQPSINWSGFISVTVSLGLVDSTCFLCVFCKVLEGLPVFFLNTLLCPRNLIPQDHKLSAAWHLSGEGNNNEKYIFPWQINKCCYRQHGRKELLGICKPGWRFIKYIQGCSIGWYLLAEMWAR